MLKIVGLVKAKGFAGERLARELRVPARAGAYENSGYKYHPELGISIQGQSAPDAWKEVGRLAQKHSIPVEIEFQWGEDEKAQYPGRIGILRAGS